MIAENPVPCEDDFFVVERTYFEFAEEKNADGSYNTYGEFWCKAIFDHPATGKLTAIGLGRDHPRSPWEEWPVTYDIDDWKINAWFRTYNGGKEDKPDA